MNRQLREHRPEVPGIAEAFEEHDEINRDGKEVLRLVREIGDAVTDGCVDDGFAVECVRNHRAVAFEQILVDAIVFIEEFERGFEPLGQSVDGLLVQTLVIDPLDLEDQTEVPGLGQKRVLVDKSIEIHALVQRAGFYVVPEDAFESKHRASISRKRERTWPDRIPGEAWRR